MALTGLQIQKLLPGTNCKECGSNTCMAFAMKLASKKAEIADCPYASDDAIETLGAATEPPVKKVTFGSKENLSTGEETVLYRHEKTFVNQTLIAININDTDDPKYIEDTLQSIKDYAYERVGEILTVDMISITQKGDNSKLFKDIAKKAYDITGKPLILKSDDTESIIEAAIEVKGSGSVLVSGSKENCAELLDTAKEHGHTISISGNDIEDIVSQTAHLRDQGFNNLILDLKTDSMAQQFQLNSIARIAAIKDSFKPLGYSLLKYIEEGNLMEDTVSAATEILKYGGICVLPFFDPGQLSSLFTLRLNIFTDPQKPIQVEPKVYPIGEPDENSPVFVTTNFSLTYFVVSGEIENSGISAWLLIPECEGMSVLTAWAAGKFNAHSIAKQVEETGLNNSISNKKIIIPGYVAQLSGDLEELLQQWEVIVGPQEASDLESFIKLKITG